MLEYSYDETMGMAFLEDDEFKFSVSEKCLQHDSSLESLYDLIEIDELEVIVWASGLDAYEQDSKVLNYLVVVRGFRIQHVKDQDDGTIVYFLVHHNFIGRSV